MTRRPVVAAAAAAVVIAPVLLAGCTEKGSSEGAIAVTSTADACDLATTDATTGNVDFTVTNSGDKVTEFYVYGNNNRVLGEVENIGPGLSGNLTVEIVEPGTYTVACKPGMVGAGIRTELNVGGERKEKADVPADVTAAKAQYLEYVRNQLNTLHAQTTSFVDSVKKGDLDAARAQFGLTRTPYERIEPVAESFPDLDPAVDMRWDDTEDGTQPFTGFHRIERFLWPPQAAEIGDAPGQITRSDAANAKETDNPQAIAEIADGLLANVTKLRDEVNKPDFEFETLSFVKGPQALIDEVAATKVDGEEDRYSHTDLWDIAANLDGSETAIATMQPIISAKNPALMDKITAQFKTVRDSVNAYREGDGYVSYTKVTPEQRKELSNQIDALSATLSQVPGLVLQQ
ncbi:iron uptake system protein EfeO [Gordonia rubripertincta]|uniref:Peptidase M75 family protein n=2 Tax=Gordonia rubripertincta TaxID=36822 RepID=A0AAW6R3X4_GORRU|nr:iron uptake system protein EfeO [Gordonia rubripertincta]ASR02363.1 Efem/EfeO family lipoprotein precursor [Gordonia rubripertincta]MBM7277323.1 peptidase M75 family protein [Gordonia rubripertincta]MDG6780324.1 peptidase M75 family protein [Gordonia rubripertincta]NKY63611.1 peptidase M75 family protein [Gordonia rubripertincta]QMU20529.1 peptidase M75 family protein [Gordonia rubripertincta]